MYVVVIAVCFSCFAFVLVGTMRISRKTQYLKPTIPAHPPVSKRSDFESVLAVLAEDVGTNHLFYPT